MEAASNHLLGDLAVREGRHCGEGVPVIGIAQAELPMCITPTGEHSKDEAGEAGDRKQIALVSSSLTT